MEQEILGLIKPDVETNELPEEMLAIVSKALGRFEAKAQTNLVYTKYVKGDLVNNLVSEALMKQFSAAIKRMGINMCPVVLSSFADRVPPIKGDYFPRTRSKIDALKLGILTYQYMTVSVDIDGRLQVFKPGEVYVEYADDEITPTIAVFIVKLKKGSMSTRDRYQVLLRDGQSAILLTVETDGGKFDVEDLAVTIEEVGSDYDLKVIDVGANGVGGIEFSAPTLEPVKPLQDAMNYSFIALVSGTEIYTNPLKQRTNYQPQMVQAADGTWQAQPIKIDPRRNNIIGVEGEGEIKQLNPIDPTALNNLRKSWGEAIATVSGLPPYEIVGSGGGETASGTALRLLSMKRDMRSKRIGQSIADALNILADGVDDDDIYSLGTLDDQTFTEKLADAQIMQSLALPTQAILEHLGYSDQKIDELLGQIEEDSNKATEHSAFGSNEVMKMIGA